MPIPRRLNILYNNKQKRHYKNVKYPAIPLNPQDIYIVASANQRLDLLAKRFYNDVDLWWVINIANPNLVPRDSIYIPIGKQIRIPANVTSIKLQFDELNQ